VEHVNYFSNRRLLWTSIGALVATHIILCFWGLGDRVLWQDEAETAVLAKNVLKFGWPVACDGKNIVSQERWLEFGPDFIWRWSGWLQIYLAAISFKLFGITTFSARFPFALLGTLTPFITFLLVKMTLKDEQVALLAMTIMVFSIPFILFERQCRYFPVLCLLTLMANIGVTGVLKNQRWAYPWYGISMLLFMQTNHLNFIFFAGSIFLSAILVFRDLKFLKRFLIINLLTAFAVFLSAAWQYRFFNQVQMLNFFEVPNTFKMAFSDAFTFFLPLPVIGIFLYVFARNFFRSTTWSNYDKFSALFGLQILLYLSSLSMSPQYFTRYLVCLIPLFAIISAIACTRIIKFSPVAGILLSGMIVFTNWMNLYPPQIFAQTLGIDNWSKTVSRQSLSFPSVPLFLYYNELRTKYRGPDDCLVAFFKAHNDPSQTILITYGALPLMFYTDFKVMDGMGIKNVPDDFKPDWLVVRRDTHVWGVPLLQTPWANDFVTSNIDLIDYNSITLSCADHTHGNRSDPHYHRFYNEVHPGNLVTVFKKKHH
jgi:hypothetical protein